MHISKLLDVAPVTSQLRRYQSFTSKHTNLKTKDKIAKKALLLSSVLFVPLGIAVSISYSGVPRSTPAILLLTLGVWYSVARHIFFWLLAKHIEAKHLAKASELRAEVRTTYRFVVYLLVILILSGTFIGLVLR